jgi:translation initiation factor eIF-2B subunit gamma
LARDEEDIEYIGLSYPSSISSSMEASSSSASSLPRLVWKQSKVDVEADEDMTGTSAKLELPKPRLRHGKLVVRTDWSDVHIYSLAPWVRQLLVARKSLKSIQGDLLPLLISRQFKGKKATFGSSPAAEGSSPEISTTMDDADDEDDDQPYTVLARVVPNKTVLRANTIPAYLFACKEVVAQGATLPMPPNSKWNGKFQSLVLEDSKLGPKLTMKSSIIGKNCTIGAKCRLNNVVVMDNVVIGENCSLQNTLIGSGASLGNNCSLNDCQVGPGKQLAAQTKEKGESLIEGDTVGEE